MKNYVLNTCFKREKKRKVTFRLGENETEIGCVDKMSTLTFFATCEGNQSKVST